MTNDLELLAERVKRSVSVHLGTATPRPCGFADADAKARSIAHFAILLAEAYAAAEITACQMSRERAELDRMVVRFVRNAEAPAPGRLTECIRSVIDGHIGHVATSAGITPPGMTLAH